MPKESFFSSSNSLNFRLAASVCQSNLGFTYIERVLERILASPTTNKIKYRQQKEIKTSRKRLFDRSLEGQKARKKRKIIRSQQNVSNEKREGVNYQSNVGQFSSSAVEVGTPIVDFVRNDKITNYRLVYFDIETTGLSKTDQIVQVLMKILLNVFVKI